MAKAQAAKPNPFAKGKGKADGHFKFKMPTTLGSGRGRIPKGKYPGRCTDIVAETSKANNPMWVWTFVITKGQYAGRDFKLWTVLTDDAAWKIVETLEALGLEVEAGQDLDIDRKEVVGVGCTLHIVDDDGQDGDDEFSKLKRISADEHGAGYRPGKGIAAARKAEEDVDDPFEEDDAAPGEDDDDAPVDDDDDLEDLDDEDPVDEDDEDPVEEEEEEEVVIPRKSAKAKMPAPTPAKKGKAPATLGRAARR